VSAQHVQVVYSDPEVAGPGLTMGELYDVLRGRLSSEAYDPSQLVVVDTGNGRDRHLLVYGISDSTDRVVLEL
jgi:hypothetical protein